MHDALSPLLYNSLFYPNMTGCFFKNELTNCSNGTCQFSEDIDVHENLGKLGECSFSKEPILEFGKLRYTPGPSKYDYDNFEFTCNKDKCNSQSIEDAVRRNIDTNSNEFIGSTAA